MLIPVDLFSHFLQKITVDISQPSSFLGKGCLRDKENCSVHKPPITLSGSESTCKRDYIQPILG
jgi:hypothetical protein